jgi:nucleoside-diphosphate-sugar epimerase
MVDVIGDISANQIWEQTLAGIDIVYHFAAQTSIYVAKDDVNADFRANVVPMLNMLKICRNKKLNPIVLFSGTVTQAGITESLPVDETYKDLPITVYDMHKLMAENYLKFYCDEKNVRGATLRLANVYGPGPSGNAGRGVLNMMIQKALAGQELTIYGKGDCLRDYVYIDDVVAAFLTAAKNIDNLNGKHFIIASGKGHTLAQAINLVADQAATKTQKPVEVKHIQPPSELSPIESRNFVADTERFTQATGWHSKYILTDGISTMMDEISEINRISTKANMV